MAWYPSEMEALRAVAAATLDKEGTLIEANAGFLGLLEGTGEPPPIGMIVTRFFIQPRFSTLAEAPEGVGGEVYNGLLTIGEFMGRRASLLARVWRVNGQLRVLAEYDIKELARLNAIVLELNHGYAKAQLELTQTNLKLQQREAEIVAISLTDQLTGVGNRRQLEQALATEVSRAERTGEPLCAFMADLDHFKRVNDDYGHDAGDKVLVTFGRLLKEGTRQTDIAARFGGEEFFVLMPHTEVERAVAIAERLRAALEAARIAPLPDPVTVSIGVAQIERGESGEAFLRRADRALYAAKEMGRNRVLAG